MAIATSMIHRSFRGAVGDFIFRNYNGKTIVSLRPVYKNETNTEARRQARGRFRDATHYASQAMQDTKQKAYYTQKARQLKLPNAYTAAITDYLRRAKVKAATRSAFAAKKDEVINIWVSKPAFKVSRVKAVLCNAHGAVLSEQDIVRRDDQHTFAFRCMDDYPDYAMLKVITDEPGSREYIITASEFMAVLG